MKNKMSMNLLLIFSVSIISVMGLTTVSPAFPKIASVFSVPASTIGLLLAVFALPGLILTPVLGVMADKYGRKKVLIPSLLLFGITGVLCTFAGSFEELLVYRFFEGVGAASLGAINITLIGDLYSGEKRIAIMGYNASVLSIGTAIFPIVGGALANIQWYFPFYLPIFAVIIGIISIFALNNIEPAKATNLKEYFSNAFKDIKNPKIFLVLFVSLSSYIILFGAFLTYIPYIVKRIDPNAMPFVIGMILSSMSIVTAIVTVFLKKLSIKISFNLLISIGFVLYAVSLLIIPFINSIAMLLIPTIIYGVAQGFFLPSTHTILASESNSQNRAGLISFNRMITQLGQSLGPLLMGQVLIFGSLDLVYYFASMIAFLTFLVMMWFIKVKR